MIKRNNGIYVRKASRYLMVLLVFFFIFSSCNHNEEDGNIIINSTKRLEIKVGVGDFKENTSGSQNEQESTIKTLSLFLFDSNGQEMVQENRQHTLNDGKITVVLPADTDGLEAYLIANQNMTSTSSISKETLLQHKSDRRPEDFINDGFPMTSGPILIPADQLQISAEVSLQRVPSALYLQVDKVKETAGIYNNSYRIEIEGLQISDGAMFKDEASSATAQGKTDYSSKLTAVNSPENLAYFYQSKEVKIHVTPKNSQLGEPKTITIDAAKSVMRNKKFLLNIKPVITPATRSLDFIIEVAEWNTELIVTEIPTIPDITPPTPPIDNGVLFAKGVNFESGWYDQAKSFGKGGFSMDSQLCWACTCTNMIQWWQDRYLESGGTLPQDAPNGFLSGRENAEYRQLVIFEEFAKKFPNISSSCFTGMIWYFPKFFPDLFSNGDIIGDDKTYLVERGVKNMQDFSEFLINGLRDGGVFYLATYGHARTIWGCQYNTETSRVEYVFLTDSDDNYPKIWRNMPVTVSEDGTPKIGNKEVQYLSVLYPYPGKVYN